MEKTAKKWFSEFPEPYRTQALKNLKPQKFESASEALGSLNSFEWADTPEGFCYWNDFYKKLLSEEK